MRELTVATRDGRLVAAAVTGDPDGIPIVFHHGTPGNRAAQNLAPTVLAGSFVITYDRPGYGRSERHRGRDVGACAFDVAAIMDELGIDRFAVFGSSGGGPHALACAALLPGRVTAAAVVAGFAPVGDPAFDVFDGMSKLNVDELRAAAAGERELTDLLERFVADADDPDSMLDEIASELSQADRDALARPEVRTVFREAIGGALRDGLGGWIDDDLAFMRPWGFELRTLSPPTLLLQGEHDVLVPRGHMAYLARSIPQARLEIVPGGGHTLFDETREVVEWLIERHTSAADGS